jgi:hypothetical protein
MSGPRLLAQLLEQDRTLPIARVKRLNPTFDQGFKAGEIFVLGDLDNHHACTRQEAELMAAAQLTRDALAELDEQEANFMMEHIGEIAGVLSGASLSMGVGKDMLSRGLGQVGDTLKGDRTVASAGVRFAWALEEPAVLCLTPGFVSAAECAIAQCVSVST